MGEIAEKSKIGGKRVVIEAFLRGVDQASFVLKENPELIFPQVYNRLQWQAEREELLKKKLKFERSRYKRSWLRLLNKPALQTSAIIRTLTGHTSVVEACGFSPDGKRIVSAGGLFDNTLKLWDAETSEEIATLKGPTSEVNACTFSSDGR